MPGHPHRSASSHSNASSAGSRRGTTRQIPAATLTRDARAISASPTRTALNSGPQKINWESNYTNDHYLNILKQQGNNAALAKYDEFKETVKASGTTAILVIKPFKGKNNTWAYDLSDRHRVLFIKNTDGSITILEGVDHYGRRDKK